MPPPPHFLSVYFFFVSIFFRLSTPHGSCITSGRSDCVQLTDYTNTAAAAPGQRRAAGGLFQEHPTKHRQEMADDTRRRQDRRQGKRQGRQLASR